MNFDSGSFSRRQADDDSEDGEEQSDSRIPLLPDVIRTAARALNGGPFAYAGKVFNSHERNIYYIEMFGEIFNALVLNPSIK